MTYRARIFPLFGAFDKDMDTHKDVAGKGTNERYQEEIGQSLDEEIVPLVGKFLESTMLPATTHENLLVHAEATKGFDAKNGTLVMGDTPEWRRRVLAYITSLHKIKGTRRAYEVMFAQLGMRVNIEEQWSDNSFDHPDLTFDSDVRPVFDAGRCSPCSTYTLEIVGSRPFEEVARFIRSVIVFNEPINAKLLWSRYNGAPFAGEELLPNTCPIIVSTAEVVPDGDQFRLQINIPPPPVRYRARYRVVGGPWTTAILAAGANVLPTLYPSGTRLDVEVYYIAQPSCKGYHYDVTWVRPCEELTCLTIVPVDNYILVYPNSALTVSERAENFAACGVTSLFVTFDEITTEFPLDPEGTLDIGPFYGGGEARLSIPNSVRPECSIVRMEPVGNSQFDPIYSVEPVNDACGDGLLAYEIRITNAPFIGGSFTPSRLWWRGVGTGMWQDAGPVTWASIYTTPNIPSGTAIEVRIDNDQNPDAPYYAGPYYAMCPPCPTDHVTTVAAPLYDSPIGNLLTVPTHDAAPGELSGWEVRYAGSDNWIPAAQVVPHAKYGGQEAYRWVYAHQPWCRTNESVVDFPYRTLSIVRSVASYAEGGVVYYHVRIMPLVNSAVFGFTPGLLTYRVGSNPTDNDYGQVTWGDDVVIGPFPPTSTITLAFHNATPSINPHIAIPVLYETLRNTYVQTQRAMQYATEDVVGTNVVVSSADQGLENDYVQAIRITGMDIPAGVLVRSARLAAPMLTGTGNLKLEVRAEKAPSPAAFSGADHDLGDREVTDAFVEWSIWIANTPLGDHVSPDLSPIIREVINQPGWVAGNPVVFLLEVTDPDSGAAEPFYVGRMELRVNWAP